MAQDTITIRFDAAELAILERLAVALEALVKQQGITAPAQPATPPTGPFLGDSNVIYEYKPAQGSMTSIADRE